MKSSRVMPSRGPRKLSVVMRPSYSKSPEMGGEIMARLPSANSDMDAFRGKIGTMTGPLVEELPCELGGGWGRCEGSLPTSRAPHGKPRFTENPSGPHPQAPRHASFSPSPTPATPPTMWM